MYLFYAVALQVGELSQVRALYYDGFRVEHWSSWNIIPFLLWTNSSPPACFFFLSTLWHRIPWSGITVEPELWPMQQQWQCWMIGLASKKFKSYVSIRPESCLKFSLCYQSSWVKGRSVQARLMTPWELEIRRVALFWINHHQSVKKSLGWNLCLQLSGNGRG